MSKKQRNKVNNAQKAMSEIGGWSHIHMYTHTYIIHKCTRTYTHITHNSEAMTDNWSDLAQEE